MLGHELHTARLVLRPVNWPDMEAVARLKADVGSFGQMLGGVRSRVQAEAEMAEDIAFWARRGVGIFSIYDKSSAGFPLRDNVSFPHHFVGSHNFVGLTGVHERPDGRGLALRISLFPWAAGRGIAREAAGHALSYTLEAGEERVIAVAKENNLASRIVLGGIGMIPIETFMRDGQKMLLYERKRHSVLVW